jgi:GAF domain-containing protein
VEPSISPTADFLAGLEKTRALLDAQGKVLAMLNEDRPLGEVLEAVCHLVEDHIDDVLASVLLLDESGERLLHGAAPSLPADYCEALHGLRIGEGVGSCGTAAATGETVIVEDIATHPYWALFKELAYDTHGLAACWSTPIRSYDRGVVATFAMYYREPRAPSDHDRNLANPCGTLVAVAVNRATEVKRLAAATAASPSG